MNYISSGQQFSENADDNIHYQLVDNFKNGIQHVFHLNVGIFIASFIAFNEYPKFLISLDFAFTVLLGVYYFVFKPLILHGIIPAYYRRDYHSTHQLFKFIKIMGQGSVMRFITVALFYIVTVSLFENGDSPLEGFKNIMIESIQVNYAWGLAIFLTVVIIYVLFYREKYVTIQEFNQRVTAILNESYLNKAGAVNEFIQIKDKELTLEKINKSKVNEVDSEIPSIFNCEEFIDVAKQIHNQVENHNQPLMRRRARK